MVRFARPAQVTLSQLQALKRYEQHFGIQQGRYYVVLTLQEAETVRAAIHERLNAPLFAGHSASVRLPFTPAISKSLARLVQGSSR
jgi:hypothetical protein